MRQPALDIALGYFFLLIDLILWDKCLGLMNLVEFTLHGTENRNIEIGHEYRQYPGYDSMRSISGCPPIDIQDGPECQCEHRHVDIQTEFNRK